jgi:hypothetical protein
MKIKKITAFLLVYVVILSIFGGGFKALSAESVTPLLNENMNTVTFTEDKSVYADTARGYYRMSTSGRLSYDTLMERRNNEKVTLTLLSMELEDFKTGPISQDALGDLEEAFSMHRIAGMMVIFRASYDRVGEESPEPKDINIILGHIRQICEVLSRNADVIYSVQAGMLGCYGEWHGSYFEDPVTGRIDFETQKKVVNEFLAYLPTELSVSVRRPIFIRNITNNTMVNSATAFSSVQSARVAFHNDALLSTDNDMNTYCDKTYTREQELQWGNTINRYLPFVGEANHFSNYCEPSTSVQYLDLLNTQSINGTYNREVTDHWKATVYRDEATYTYIQKKLGYRFVINNAGLNTNTWQGNFLHLNMSFVNDGFGNLLRPTDFEIVLTGGNKTYTTKIDEDPRRWDDDAGALKRDWYFSLPSDMPAGNYTVSLKLSSTYSSIKNNPLYNIRFASNGVWDAATGLNTLGKITVGAPENAGLKVSSFKQISQDEASVLNNSSKDYAAKATANSTSAAANEAAADESGKAITVSEDSEYLYINLKSVNPTVKRQVFINTNGNSSDGYKASKTESGFEWMIEGKYFFRYTGESGTDSWSWSENKSIMATETNGGAQYILPLSAIGLSSPASATILYQYEDGKTADVKVVYKGSEVSANTPIPQTPLPSIPEAAVPDVSPTPSVPETTPVLTPTINVYTSGTSLVVEQQNVDTKAKHQVFIDSDGSSSTGFALSKSKGQTGYDYLIENSRLYRFVGSNGSDGWDWERFETSNYAVSGNNITHTIPLKTFGINSRVTIHTVYRRDDDKTTDTRRDCIIDASSFPEEIIIIPPPEQAQPEQAQPEQAQPEQAQPEQAQTEPPLVEQPQTEPPQTEPPSVEQPQTEPPGNNGNNGNGNGNNKPKTNNGKK